MPLAEPRPPKPRQADEYVYQLTFRPLESSIPIGVRLRRVLRYALRETRLRCIEVRETANGPAK